MTIGKKILFIVYFFLLILFNYNSYSYAEDLAGFEYSSSPSSKCTDYITSRGFVEGLYKEINGQNVMLICGSAAVKASPSNKIFIDARQVGYEVAILNAKANYANFIELIIRDEVTNIIQTGLKTKEEREKGKLLTEGTMLFDKLIALAQNEVDYLLKERGVENPVQKPDQVEEVVKEFISTEGFKKTTSTYANSQLAGLQVNKVFESCEKGSKQCEITLAMAWSDNSAAVANSIFNSVASIAPKGEPGKPIMERLPKNNQDVLANIGPRMYRDENGDYHIIAIATALPQSDTKSAKNYAKKAARTIATSYIRQFTGETVDSTGKLIIAQNYSEFVKAAEEIKYNRQYNEKLESKGKALKIIGISPFKDGSFSHPANPDLLGVWVAMRWSVNSLESALETKIVIEDKTSESESNVEETSTSDSDTKIETTTEIESESSDF